MTSSTDGLVGFLRAQQHLYCSAKLVLRVPLGTDARENIHGVESITFTCRPGFHGCKFGLGERST